MDDFSKRRQSLSDIRIPRASVSHEARVRDNGNAPKRTLHDGPPRHGVPGVFRIGILFFSVAVMVYIIITAVVAARVPQSVSISTEHINEGVKNLWDLDAEGAMENFGKVKKEISLFSPGELSILQPFFSSATGILSGISGIAGSGIAVAEDIDYIQTHAVDILTGYDDNDVVVRLERVRDVLADIRGDTQAVTSHASTLGEKTSIFSELITPYSFDIATFEQFLDTIIVWLRNPSGRKIIVAFQNPAEMRPAGGFFGSFAEVELRDGILTSSTVRDIVEADREFDDNVIPPAPLQSLVRRWKAADSNWFFDFPLSADHMISFLEHSNLYQNTSTTFDGLVAISPKIAKDILSITGPVEVEGLGILTADTFLEELQKSVQTEQAAGSDIPKQSLAIFFERIRTHVHEFNDVQKKQLFDMIGTWLRAREVMIFVKDAPLEGMIKYYGAGGEVYNPPDDFEGDYLAVVDANVGGGKTDRFIAQKVVFESQLDEQGIVNNHLVIERTHQGDKSPYWWNRLANDNYVQIFVPERARLVNISGGSKVSASPRRYGGDFQDDPLVAEIERGTNVDIAFPQITSHVESGKRVFATRMVTPLKSSSKVVVDYSHRLFVAPSEGTRYQFVFEKQAGSLREYHFSISAPVGFFFRENQLPVWSYISFDPPGRFMVSLTLQKLQ
ncbi:MAG: DUF4012 domain-containing protein [Patescibacteria group bacterium]|nr:DUF4012 domain-containing protein [Patescibacteria group bacterium]